MQCNPQGMWSIMDDWFSQRTRRNILKRNNLMAASDNEDTISKKLNDSMMERVFDNH
jgi:hypothetical protein